MAGMGVIREYAMRRLLPPVMLQLYRAVGATWRYQAHNEQRLRECVSGGNAVVGAFLHARTFPLLYFFSRPGRGRWVLMCSQSRDGDAIAYVEHRLGFELVRGSSGRGGARALVALIKKQRNDPALSAGLAIDGSRGPRGVAQVGALALAQKTGGMVLPIAASTRQSWVYRRSWDRLVLPRPFATIHVNIGEPIRVPREADAAALETLRLQLELAVLTLNGETDTLAGFRDSKPLRAEG
jgi:lysophospholipid acyltransferase (LPLAT)-like uncharacterized protein